MARKHDDVAEQIAKARGGKYDSRHTPDVRTPSQVVEVEVKRNTLGDGIDQLKQYRGQKPRYLGVTSELVPEAKKLTKGTGIGVMAPTGRIAKRAGGRGRKR